MRCIRCHAKFTRKEILTYTDVCFTCTERERQALESMRRAAKEPSTPDKSLQPMTKEQICVFVLIIVVQSLLYTWVQAPGTTVQEFLVNLFVGALIVLLLGLAVILLEQYKERRKGPNK